MSIDCLDLFCQFFLVKANSSMVDAQVCMLLKRHGSFCLQCLSINWLWTHLWEKNNMVIFSSCQHCYKPFKQLNQPSHIIKFVLFLCHRSSGVFRVWRLAQQGGFTGKAGAGSGSAICGPSQRQPGGDSPERPA